MSTENTNGTPQPGSELSKYLTDVFSTKEHPEKWFVDDINDDIKVCVRIKKHMHSAESEFQQIDIFELGTYGKCLVLDGKMQSSEFDEWVFHENLVQPVMCQHPNPERVFIAGGGEGATLREVLRFNTVKKCTMVDIDGKGVDECRKHLKHHSNGAFEDPRAELIIGDAKKYIEETNELFDVLIMDLSDPCDGGPATLLYTVNFYKKLITKLKPNGLLVTHCGPASMITLKDLFTPIYKTLTQAFTKTFPYVAHVPSFSDCYGFVLCSPDANTKLITKDEVNKRLAERLKGTNHFYDGEAHEGVFGLPLYVRKALQEETCIITEDNPRFIF